MYSQSQLFTGIHPQPKTTQKSPIDKIGYSHLAIPDYTELTKTSNKANWNDSIEKAGRHKEATAFYNKGFIQQKAGLGILQQFIPSNYIGVRSIRDREVEDFSAQLTGGFYRVNSSRCKLPHETILYSPPNPIKFS
jgi:hypothetical protein